MPALDFPANPAVNQQYTANGKSWYWTGVIWRALGSGQNAPSSAQFLVATADELLTNERVVTNSSSITWTFASGTATAVVPTGGITLPMLAVSGTPINGNVLTFQGGALVWGTATVNAVATYGPTPGTGPMVALHVDSETGAIFANITDVDSTQWVEVGGAGSGVALVAGSEPALVQAAYGRGNASQVVSLTLPSAPTPGNTLVLLGSGGGMSDRRNPIPSGFDLVDTENGTVQASGSHDAWVGQRSVTSGMATTYTVLTGSGSNEFQNFALFEVGGNVNATVNAVVGGPSYQNSVIGGSVPTFPGVRALATLQWSSSAKITAFTGDGFTTRRAFPAANVTGWDARTGAVMYDVAQPGTRTISANLDGNTTEPILFMFYITPV